MACEPQTDAARSPVALRDTFRWPGSESSRTITGTSVLRASPQMGWGWPTLGDAPSCTHFNVIPGQNEYMQGQLLTKGGSVSHP